MIDTEELRRSIQVIRENIKRMFVLRGSGVAIRENETEVSFAKNPEYDYIFVNPIEKMLTVVYAYNLNSTNEVKLNRADFNRYCAHFSSLTFEEYPAYEKTMMIVLGSMTPKSVKGVKKNARLEHTRTGKNIEIFYKNFFSYFAMDHDLVPEHFLYRKGQATVDLLTEFRLTDKRPAMITTNDVVSRLFGARVGDCFKIIRPNFAIGGEIMIRKVIVPEGD